MTETVHETDVQKTEHVHHEGRSTPTWLVRMALGILGILLLAFAIVASQTHMNLGAAGTFLPWVIVGAILLGAAALIESITSTVWVTLIGGIFLIFAAFILAGRISVEFDAVDHAVFEVDRFTGETRVCTMNECRVLPGTDESVKPPEIRLPLPKVLPPDQKH